MAWEIITREGQERFLDALDVFDLSQLPLVLPRHVSLAEASSTSGNVAHTTNDELAKLSAEEVAAIKAGPDAQIVEHPEELQHATAFFKLMPEQQEHAG